MIPTPISEEVNDDDHETSDQVATKPRRSSRVRSAPEWCSNHVLEVMLLDHDEPTNYEEAMVSPDSGKWLEAMNSENGSFPEKEFLSKEVSGRKVELDKVICTFSRIGK